MKNDVLTTILSMLFILSPSMGESVGASGVAFAATPVMSFPMEMNEDGEVSETVKSKTYTVRGKHADNVVGVEGKALRLDGYSSFVQVSLANTPFSTLNSQFSISFWTICQTYPMMVLDVADNQEGAIISCLDDTNKKGFAFFLYSQGKYGFSCYVNGEKKTLSPAALFPKQEWVHLCATVDAASGSIVLYQNGQQVASSYAKGTINTPSGNLYIGKSTTDVKSGQFYLNTYNGAIDELNVYSEVLSANEVQTQFSSSPSRGGREGLNIPASHWASDITRPRHHAMPASNWMNESHGMTYADGKYHVFFQKNGNGPYMSRLHWGHVSSPDLCNWTEERIAIAPEKAYDIKGCWSGCVFSDQAITHGEPWILYTGVSNARATINMASPVDEGLDTWTKATNNPVINGTPEGYSADFRDPYFFRSGNDAYCIVGTGRNGVASTSLHKYNPSTKVFDYTGTPFFTGANAGQCGTFFEMPNVTPMENNKWLFTATPLGTSRGVRTIYYVGSINSNGTFQTTQSAPKTVELSGMARDGYGLLSPTIYQHDGKTIALGIVPDKLSGTQNYNMGWAHTLSFPREWSIDAQGELVQKPYSGLAALRSETMVTKDEQTLNGDLPLDPVKGFEIEVEASFTVGSSPFGIKLLQAANGTACKVFFNPSTNMFTVDCSAIGRKSNDEGVFNGVYSSGMPVSIGKGQTMKIHLFFDHSILDVFINDRWATSVRVFPTSASATGVSLFADGATTLQSAKAWTMKANEDPTQDIVAPSLQGRSGEASKTLRDGQLLIEQNNRTYTILGNQIH